MNAVAPDSSERKEVCAHAAARRDALKLSLSYALFGFLWILIGDRLLHLWSGSAEFVLQAQTIKGWFFVGGSAALIYFMTHTALRRARRAEEASRLNEWRFAQVAEKAPGGIFITDSKGACIFANKRWKALTGLSNTEPLDCGWHGAIHPEDRAEVLQSWDEAVRCEQPWGREFRLQRPDGSTSWVLASAAAEHTPEGKLIGHVVVCTDVTEHRELEASLHESEVRYREFVEHARDAVFEISPAGAFLSANAFSEEITGMERRDWIGCNFAPLVHPEDLPRAQKIFLEAIQGLRPPVFELRLKTARCSFVEMEFTLAPRMKNGTVVGILGIGRDVSERKRLEEQFRQAQKMEAVGLLAGGIAHDFNNLLTVIYGSAELVQLSVQTSEDAAALAEITRAASRAADLTSQLLAFSRKQELQSRELDLNDAVAGTAKLLQRLIGADVQLELECAANPIPVSADPGMLEQILMNFAVNSRAAMPGGGVLKITTEVAEISTAATLENRAARPGKFACLCVSDTGTGITPENLERIFEPFFTTKEAGRGTGLGLATVFGIVKQHRGWIDVESEVNRGTTFHVYLPLSEAAAAAPSVVTQPALRLGGKEHILVVEDEGAVRNLIRAILEGGGYRVSEARTGAAAIALWEKECETIDLLLTDLVLPDGHNGRQLAADFCSRKAALKVLLSTGYTSGWVEREAATQPNVAMLRKPYVPSKLLQAVRESLDS
ncbi:MAG TPA: PAS domain S-box protein [Chthoniobacteraceae bacterium]|jgi:PAS domain S-box-containing protein